MAGLNILLGLYFLANGGAPASDEAADTACTTFPSAGVPPRSGSALIACAALSGLLAGALEGDMFKRIDFIVVLSPGATMSFISFWAVLGIFLASIIVRHVERIRLAHIKGAYGLAALYYFALWRFSDELTYLVGNPPDVRGVHHFPVSLSQLFVYTGIYVLPSYLLISLLLPYVCNRLQGMGKHLGLAYGLNTVGFCLGLIAFTSGGTSPEHLLFVEALSGLYGARRDRLGIHLGIPSHQSMADRCLGSFCRHRLYCHAKKIRPRFFYAPNVAQHCCGSRHEEQRRPYYVFSRASEQQHEALLRPPVHVGYIAAIPAVHASDGALSLARPSASREGPADLFRGRQHRLGHRRP